MEKSKADGKHFIGSWKLDLNSYDDSIEDFAKAGGMTDDIIKMYRTMPYTVIYKKNGDEWSYDMIREPPFPNQHYTFKPGEEVNTINAMKKKVRFTVNFESDSKMTEDEYAEEMGDKHVVITREVKGKVLEVNVKLPSDEIEANFKLYKQDTDTTNSC